jgi:hypothetical protein
MINMAAKKKVHGKATQISGFKKVETHLAGFWKPTADGQHLQGIVVQAIEVRGHEDKPNTFYTVQLTAETGGPIKDGDDKTIKTEIGMIVGVGGKMLLTFLRNREGKEVMLVYRGLGSKKAGQNAPKLYDTYEREGDE